MTPYANKGGESGIVEYEIGQDIITVKFAQGTFRHYQYTSLSVGKQNLNMMARLAADGSGLNSFINLNVKNDYSDKY